MTCKPTQFLSQSSMTVLLVPALVFLSACGGGGADEGNAQSPDTIVEQPTTPPSSENPPPAPTPNAAPEITLIAPTSGSDFIQGAEISFEATASDQEDGDLSANIQWSSNLDGNMGTGGVLARALSLGEHSITASIVDSENESAQITLNLSVFRPNSAPEITITAPTDINSVESDTAVTFAATATDEEDGDLSGSIQWSSNIDGVIGTGASINSTLTVGNHQITASVSDSAAENVQTSLNVEVTEPVLPPSQGSDRIEIEVYVSRTQCIAPCGVMFDATDTTSLDFTESFHELQFHWDFNDQNASFENRPEVEANQSISPIAGHVFKNAGTYDVLLTVSDTNGEVATQVVRVIVDNPETAFAELTYCVSNTNDFASCPSSDSEFHLNSFEEAASILSTIRNFQNQRPARVLFRAGETFTTGLNRVGISGLSAQLLISSYGNGEKPVIAVNEATTAGELFYLSSNNGFTVSNLYFRGNYDPVTGLGNHPNGFFIWAQSQNYLFYQNKFSGLGLNIYPNGYDNTKHQMIVDNHITDWQDYAILGNFGYLSTVLANHIKQNPNAVSGGEGKCGDCVPNYADHGPLRTAEPDHLLVQFNDMFNNAGWSTAGLAHQPNIRLGTNGEVIDSIVSDNRLNGGFNTLEMVPANNGPGSSAVRGKVIIERNTFTASENTTSFINSSLGGVVIRNNVFFKPNNGGPSIGTGTFKSAIWFASSNTTAENLTHTNWIYNNTLNSEALTSSPNLAFLEVSNNFTQFAVYNNLANMPHVQGGQDAGLISWKHSGAKTGLVEDNNLLYAPNTTNYIYDNGSQTDLDTWQASGNAANSMVASPELDTNSEFGEELTLSSPAINAGTAISGLFTDYQSSSRETTVDIGAHEKE
ncbi:PKD domain-containing protein [Aliikangiella marina]|uniref:PKD domain-containing protein n=1 Tax=Aliikangiella marina TaxID=1712262 RepID=A0A545TBJ2_9GAMM|nr:PKD domain-containing protein [Aliikangiella marina]TQV74588.1 PKD domain-containing protein [Aliikangiella marina]